MKKLLIISIVLSLCSCRNLINMQQSYLYQQNKGKFSVDLKSPQFPAGESGAQFDSPFPFAPLRNVTVDVIYFPIEDAACLKFNVDTYTFHQFWSKESREAFIEALDSYSKEFNAQKLSKSGRKTRNLYGSVNGYLYWQATRFTVQAKGDMMMEMGYYFKEKAPFFTITQGDAIFVNRLKDDDDQNMHSGERPMYLTKAQATQIAECFDQQHLLSLVPSDTLRTLPAQRLNAPLEMDYY